ncbi:MAG: hypothetical protein U0270_13925 [Labilithrix sp.]
MKKAILALVALSSIVFACEGEGNDTLTGGGIGGGATRVPSKNKEETAGVEDTTYSHSNDPAGASDVPFQPADPAQVRAVGSPEVTSRLHSCGKLSVASLGRFLESRGVKGTGARPDGTQSGKDLFAKPDTAAALGAANYGGRVPEAPFASTSAISKMYDIFAMASYDIVADDWNPPACPSVKMIIDGKFSKDGISCLLGKPATDEYVAIANDAITKNPTDGAKIAIAAMLAAAHTCQ